MIRYTCECGKAYRFGDDKAGSRVKCAVCGAVDRLPGVVTPSYTPSDAGGADTGGSSPTGPVADSLASSKRISGTADDTLPARWGSLGIETQVAVRSAAEAGCWHGGLQKALGWAGIVILTPIAIRAEGWLRWLSITGIIALALNYWRLMRLHRACPWAKIHVPFMRRMGACIASGLPVGDALVQTCRALLPSVDETGVAEVLSVAEEQYRLWEHGRAPFEVANLLDALSQLIESSGDESWNDYGLACLVVAEIVEQAYGGLERMAYLEAQYGTVSSMPTR